MTYIISHQFPISHTIHGPAAPRIVNSEENIDIRRAAALVIANASSDTGNLVGKPRAWMGGGVGDGEKNRGGFLPS